MACDPEALDIIRKSIPHPTEVQLAYFEAQWSQFSKAFRSFRTGRKREQWNRTQTIPGGVWDELMSRLDQVGEPLEALFWERVVQRTPAAWTAVVNASGEYTELLEWLSVRRRPTGGRPSSPTSLATFMVARLTTKRGNLAPLHYKKRNKGLIVGKGAACRLAALCANRAGLKDVTAEAVRRATRPKPAPRWE